MLQIPETDRATVKEVFQERAKQLQVVYSKRTNTLLRAVINSQSVNVSASSSAWSSLYSLNPRSGSGHETKSSHSLIQFLTSARVTSRFSES